ncbi:MAG: hypothetical protein WCO63_03265 [Bacteroidota bacterium]
MNKGESQLSNLDKLILEKQRLITYCDYQEKLISYKFNDLKKNFPDIITQEILPFSPEKNKDVGSMLDFVNDFILRLLPGRFGKSRMAGILLKVVEGIVIRGFSKTRRGD